MGPKHFSPTKPEPESAASHCPAIGSTVFQHAGRQAPAPLWETDCNRTDINRIDTIQNQYNSPTHSDSRVVLVSPGQHNGTTYVAFYAAEILDDGSSSATGRISTAAAPIAYELGPVHLILPVATCSGHSPPQAHGRSSCSSARPGAYSLKFIPSP